MKFVQILLLLLLSNSLFSQKKVIDTLKEKKVTDGLQKIKPGKDSSKSKATITHGPKRNGASTATMKRDTLKVSLKDSAKVSYAHHVDSTRIILVKDQPDLDDQFQKYWFPLIALLIGAAITLASEFVRTYFATRKAGRRWIGQAKLYLRTIESQERLIQEFLDAENPNKWGIEALNRTSHIEGYQFNSYRHDELLNYLEQSRFKKEDEALYLTGQLTGTLNALALNYKQLDDSYRLYDTNISRYSKEANDILRDLNKAITDWISATGQRGFQIGEKAALDKAIQLFTTEVINKNQEDLWDIFALEQNLYDPMVQVLSLHYPIPEVLVILKQLEVAKYAVKKIKAEKHYMIENAKTLQARYNEYRTELANNINGITKFKGIKTKPV